MSITVSIQFAISLSSYCVNEETFEEFDLAVIPYNNEHFFNYQQFGFCFLALDA